MKFGKRDFWVVFVCLAFAFVFIMKSVPVEQMHLCPFYRVVQQYLKEKLRVSATSSLQPQLSKKQQVIYVMGGNEKNLQSRFRKASLLFHAGKGDKIWVYIQPGITNFDHTLKRNLTNREWVRRQFARFNIAAENISFIDLEEGFWGTLSESREIPEQVRGQGYSYLNIVTSAYHTRRVWLSFSIFSEAYGLPFSVYAADDEMSVSYLLKEYGKLLLYKKILLPFLVPH